MPWPHGGPASMPGRHDRVGAVREEVMPAGCPLERPLCTSHRGGPELVSKPRATGCFLPQESLAVK